MNTRKLLAQKADANLMKLGDSKNLGQGFVVGLDEQGENLVQICWVLDQNRTFKNDGAGRVFTEFVDFEKNKAFSPLRYNVMREATRWSITYAVVSSGNQTDVVAEKLAQGIDMNSSLRHFSYAPDMPNFTPRITAECHWEREKPVIEMSLLRKSPFSFACDRSFEINGMGTGFGYGMTTHLNDEESSSPFQDEPFFIVPLLGSIGKIADTYLQTLDLNNGGISLAVKMIPRKYCSQIFLVNQ